MRCSGILTPVFSLPGPHGVGDFGETAYRFIDRLSKINMKIWQILPLNPVGFGYSPYQPFSSAAGETLYISLDLLYAEGLLSKKPPLFNAYAKKVDYEAVRAFKEPYFQEAVRNFQKNSENDPEFQRFLQNEWLYPYAVFKTLSEKNDGRPWMTWDADEKNLIQVPEALQEAVEEEMVLQYFFFRQWTALKAYANEKGIRIMGDIPFYAGQDSADVWANRDCFLLDAEGYPTSVAGVPPDYFSEDGQRWGNPIYDWEKLEKDGFQFLIDRIRDSAKLYDILRIDHFRAFDTYWKIPAECETARDGEWIEAPGYAFFDMLLPKIGELQIVAEDLGEMRPEVYVLRDHYDFPGMAVMEFIMANDNRDELVKENMIAYSGTHDNDTAKGWWEAMDEETKARHLNAFRKAGFEDPARNIPKALCEFVLFLPTRYAILPIQDILGLGHEARINEPGKVNDVNWRFKLADFDAFDASLSWLCEVIRKSGRS